MASSIKENYETKSELKSLINNQVFEAFFNEMYVSQASDVLREDLPSLTEEVTELQSRVVDYLVSIGLTFKSNTATIFCAIRLFHLFYASLNYNISQEYIDTVVLTCFYVADKCHRTSMQTEKFLLLPVLISSFFNNVAFESVEKMEIILLNKVGFDQLTYGSFYDLSFLTLKLFYSQAKEVSINIVASFKHFMRLVLEMSLIFMHFNLFLSMDKADLELAVIVSAFNAFNDDSSEELVALFEQFFINLLAGDEERKTNIANYSNLVTEVYTLYRQNGNHTAVVSYDLSYLLQIL